MRSVISFSISFFDFSTSFTCALINSYLSETSLYSSIADTFTFPKDLIFCLSSLSRLCACFESSISTAHSSASRLVNSYSSQSFEIISSYCFWMLIFLSSSLASSLPEVSRSDVLSRSTVLISALRFSSCSLSALIFSIAFERSFWFAISLSISAFADSISAVFSRITLLILSISWFSSAFLSRFSLPVDFAKTISELRASISFCEETISSRRFCNCKEISSRFFVSSALLPVSSFTFSSAAKIFLLSSTRSCFAEFLSFSRISILRRQFVISFIAFSTEAPAFASSLSQALFSASSLTRSCRRFERSACEPRSWASNAEYSREISTLLFSAPFDFCSRTAVCFLSVSISLALLRSPVFLLSEPPVSEPPALTTWPSRVTILNL